MMRFFLPFAAALAMIAAAASARAECYADYKAKQDNPLRLHYGVIQLPDAACGSTDQAAAAIAGRLAGAGWQVLTVMSVFDETGLEGRKKSAGDYFLRY